MGACTEQVLGEYAKGLASRPQPQAKLLGSPWPCTHRSGIKEGSVPGTSSASAPAASAVSPGLLSSFSLMEKGGNKSSLEKNPGPEARALPLAILESLCGGRGPTYKALVGAAGQVLGGIFQQGVQVLRAGGHCAGLPGTGAEEAERGVQAGMDL